MLEAQVNYYEWPATVIRVVRPPIRTTFESRLMRLQVGASPLLFCAHEVLPHNGFLVVLFVCVIYLFVVCFVVFGCCVLRYLFLCFWVSGTALSSSIHWPEHPCRRMILFNLPVHPLARASMLTMIRPVLPVHPLAKSIHVHTMTKSLLPGRLTKRPCYRCIRWPKHPCPHDENVHVACACIVQSIHARPRDNNIHATSASIGQHIDLLEPLCPHDETIHDSIASVGQSDDDNNRATSASSGVQLPFKAFLRTQIQANIDFARAKPQKATKSLFGFVREGCHNPTLRI